MTADGTTPRGEEVVEARLRDIVRQHRTQLFEPFRESLAASPNLEDELSRIVDKLQVFFNKWTVEVIIVLSQAPTLRFNEIRERLSGISSRTLSQRLKELEDQGLVARKVYDERPVRIEYSLTRKGLDVAYLSLPLVLYLRSA